MMRPFGVKPKNKTVQAGPKLTISYHLKWVITRILLSWGFELPSDTKNSIFIFIFLF
jgi:methionyl-tRNA synthetase